MSIYKPTQRKNIVLWLIFLLGFFWKRATSGAALTAALLTIPLSIILKFLPQWTQGAFPDYPFLDRMTIVFLVLLVLMIVVSLMSRTKQNDVIVIDTGLFRCSPAFITWAALIFGVLAALYTVFW